MAGSQSQHTMYLNVVPGLLTGITTLTSGLASINTQFQNITKQTVKEFSIVEGVISAATVLAIQFTKTMVDSYASFEQGMKIVQVVSNQSAEGLDQLKQKANEFSVQYRTDIDQITEGLQTLGRAGLNSASEQAEVLENGLQTAKLEGRELNTVLQEIIQNTALLGGDLKSDQFGEQTEYVNDLLVATSMTAPITTHDISETLKYSGGIAAAAGANIESDEGKEILTDYMASIAAFAQKGVSGSIAGTALRAFFNKPATQDSSVVEGLGMVGLTPADLWEEGGERMKPVSEQIGLIKKQMDELNISTMDQLQIWSKIVGGKMGQQMMKLDSEDIKELTKDIKSADNASNLANASMKTYEATTKEISESWAAIQRNTGEHFVRMLTPIITAIDWISKALSNPVFGYIFSGALAIGIGYGLTTIWKIIQGIKSDLMIFVDMIRNKVNVAQNEEITKLRENIAELKEKNADELEIIRLKQEELKLQDAINNATAVQRTGRSAQVVWSAQDQAKFAQLGITSKMGQLTNMFNAELTAGSAFSMQTSLYKELQATGMYTGNQMSNLVRWINEGMREIEITADMTMDELMAKIEALYATSNQAASSVQRSASSEAQSNAAKSTAAGANNELANTIMAEYRAATQDAEANMADATAKSESATATEATAKATEDATTFSYTFTNNLEKLGITFQEMSVLADRLSVSLETELTLEKAFQNMRNNSINNMMYQNALAMERSINPATGLPYRNLAKASNYANTAVATSAQINAASAAYQKQMNNITKANPLTSGLNQQQLQQVLAEEKRLKSELAKQNAIEKANTFERQRLLGILGPIAGETTENLEIQRQQLQADMEIEMEKINYLRDLQTMTTEQFVELEAATNSYREHNLLLTQINNELRTRLTGEELETFETEESIFKKKMGNVLEDQINAENEAQFTAEKAETMSVLSYIGGPVGAAMLGLMVGMELWMHYVQDTQKKIQEAVQQYEDALSEWQSAEDEYRQSLKEANPGATSEELDDIELETYGKMYDDLVDAMDNNADAWEEMASGVTEKLPQYEYDEETDTMKLVEESISSEEATQKELDKNTKALYSAIEALNSAMSKYSQQATDSWSGTDGMISSPARKKELMQENPLWALPLGFMSLFDGSLASTFEKWDYGWEYERDFILTNQQKSDDYMGSTEITGLLLEDFKDANGDYIEGLRTVMGQSVNDFAAILPTASQQLLSSIAEMSSQISAQGNIKLQMSMKNDKKTWQQLAKEIAKYETKNKKSVGAQDTGEKKLENLIKKLELTTGGGFDRTQILQAAYIQQMSDMLSVAKEQIVPVIQQNMQTAMQNLFANMDTKENVTGTGDSTYATYSTAQAIAAMVAQIAWATAGEALYNEAMLIDPNTADPDQKRLYDAAQKADNAQDFVKDIVGQSYEPEKDLGYYLTHGIIMNPIWSDDSDQAWTYGADLLLKGFGAGTYKSVYGMSPVAAQEKAEYWVDYYREQGSSTAEIYHTFAQNYMTDGFINQIISAYEAADLGSGTDDDTGTGSDSGSGSDSDSDTGNTKNRVDLVLCNKKEIPKLNVNLFKKEPSFTVLNKNFKVRDIKVNTQDKPKAILSSVKNAIIDVEKRTDPKIIQDEAGEYDPVAATEGNSTPSGNTSTKIDS